MYRITNHISNKTKELKTFEADKIATLHANPGLRYYNGKDEWRCFEGNYYLLNEKKELIEVFKIRIMFTKYYPHSFPIVFLLDDKIEKTDDYHIDKSGLICFDHTYIINAIARTGIKIYDFVEYYLSKYFSWALVKKYGDESQLKEWAHKENGTIQFYEELLKTKDKNLIKTFLISYYNADKPQRNDKCYCGNGNKIKHCHSEEIQFLRNTPKKDIKNDIKLFE